MQSKNLQSGYIALISVIIMSALLLTITVALSSANYFSRYNILENEYKQHSSDLAEACINYVKGQLAGNPGYTVTTITPVMVGSDSCAIISAGGLTVKAQGAYPKTGPDISFTNLTVVLNSNLTVNFWRETAN
jgi:hypothetical protein